MEEREGREGRWEEQKYLLANFSSIQVAQFHPNGKYIATGSSDHTCRLWDIHSGQCVRLLAGKKVT